jgi:hypothetical protein
VIERPIAARFCLGVSAAVVAGLVLATLVQDGRLILTSTLRPQHPLPIYQLMPTPGTSPFAGAPGAAGADFSQVYTSAQALRHGQSAYQPTSPEFADRFGRPPGYPPLMNWVYLPLSFLPYWAALLLHLGLSLAALGAVTIMTLRGAGLPALVAPVLLTQAALLFLTPAGVTFLERGQFDLLVATACALLLACLYLPRRTLPLALAAGLIGALKWTSVPFVVGFAAVALIGTGRWPLALAPAALALGTFAFWSGLRQYWRTIEVYELGLPPFGLTLQHFLPRVAAKAVPVAATAMTGVLLLLQPAPERGRRFQAAALPFALCLANFTVCFATVSYEYHTVTALGLLPALVVWADGATVVPRAVRSAVCATHGLFLVVAFRTLDVLVPLDPRSLTILYALFALIFLGLAASLIVDRGRTAAAR